MFEERDRIIKKLDDKYGTTSNCDYISIMQKEQEIDQRERAIDLQQEILEALCGIKSAIDDS